MFAKLAQFRLRHGGSSRRAWVTHPNHTGNPAACRPMLAASRRLRRPMLVCHWQHAPATGALECVWESISAPATGQPRPGRSLGEVRRLTDARIAAKRPFSRAAA